MRKLQTEDTTI